MKMVKRTRFYSENLNVKDQLGDVDIAGIIIPKWIEEVGCKEDSWIRLVKNKIQWRAILNMKMKPSSSIKGKEFLD